MYVNPLETPQSTTGTVDVYYYIFAFPLNALVFGQRTQKYQAPSFNVGSQSAAVSKGKTVFKLAKEGKDINSTNLEDYIIHSDARSPMIHSREIRVAGPDPTSPGGFGYTFYHNLGYIPIFFAWQYGTGNQLDVFVPFYTDSEGDAIFLVDEEKIVYQRSSRTTVSVVVLKDPFIVDNIINVTI